MAEMTLQEEEKRAEKLLEYFFPYGTLIVRPIIDNDGKVIFSQEELNDTIKFLEIHGYANYRLDYTFHPNSKDTYVELTDTGRAVKHYKTFAEYDRVVKEQQEQERKRQEMQDNLVASQISTNKVTKAVMWLTFITALGSLCVGLGALYLQNADKTDKERILWLERTKDSLQNKLSQKHLDTMFFQTDTISVRLSRKQIKEPK